MQLRIRVEAYDKWGSIVHDATSTSCTEQSDLVTNVIAALRAVGEPVGWEVSDLLALAGFLSVSEDAYGTAETPENKAFRDACDAYLKAREK